MRTMTIKMTRMKIVITPVENLIMAVGGSCAVLVVTQGFSWGGGGGGSDGGGDGDGDGGEGGIQVGIGEGGGDGDTNRGGEGTLIDKISRDGRRMGLRLNFSWGRGSGGSGGGGGDG